MAACFAAVFAAASPALAAPAYFTPSGGTPIGSNAQCGAAVVSPAHDTVGVSGSDCGQAGYLASGRTFRFAQALITIPNHNGSVFSDPWLYVALDSSTSANFNYARAGIAPCGCTASGWVAFVDVRQPGSSPVSVTFPIAATAEGAGVLVSAFLVPDGSAVQFTIKLPNGTTYTPTVPVNSPTYIRAQALADWAWAEVNSGSPQPVAPFVKTRDTQFMEGRFTTTSGAKGTFSGPWTLNGVQATSNGHLPPKGTLIGDPSYLWTDGLGIGSLDAFGVWRYPF